MFNKNQLLVGMLIVDLIIQHYVLQETKKENNRRAKIIDYLITILEKYDVEYDEFDVIALSDLGITFKEKDIGETDART